MILHALLHNKARSVVSLTVPHRLGSKRIYIDLSSVSAHYCCNLEHSTFGLVLLILSDTII